MKVSKVLTVLMCFVSLNVFAESIKISVINETGKSLNYVIKGPTINSELILPPFINGFEHFRNRAEGLVYVNKGINSPQGLFRIGYDAAHYCEFRYLLNIENSTSWFMYPVNWVGMSKVGCAVDPDSHQIIVFQKMG